MSGTSNLILANSQQPLKYPLSVCSFYVLAAALLSASLSLCCVWCLSRHTLQPYKLAVASTPQLQPSDQPVINLIHSLPLTLPKSHSQCTHSEAHQPHTHTRHTHNTGAAGQKNRTVVPCAMSGASCMVASPLVTPTAVRWQVLVRPYPPSLVGTCAVVPVKGWILEHPLFGANQLCLCQLVYLS